MRHAIRFFDTMRPDPLPTAADERGRFEEADEALEKEAITCGRRSARSEGVCSAETKERPEPTLLGAVVEKDGVAKMGSSTGR